MVDNGDKKCARKHVVKVRMSDVEMAILDTICLTKQKTRSDVIRELITLSYINM